MSRQGRRVNGIVPLRGGVPIVVDGHVVGAVGVSGASSAEDEQAALAGPAALLASSGADRSADGRVGSQFMAPRNAATPLRHDQAGPIRRGTVEANIAG
ncbi:MAG TPA: heme-binding protein [Longimicrobiales bacterium]|nr:heme-binding protein [Longimicrobiales bacterium]